MPSQEEALRCFTALSLVAPLHSTGFLLGVGLDAPGETLALAATGLGMPALFIEQDAANVRQSMQSGACAFAVNSVDEALRMLKNEIRRKRGVSVALQADITEALQEVHSRGVAPYSIAVTGNVSAPTIERIAGIISSGAQLLGGFGLQTLALSVVATDLEEVLGTALRDKWQITREEATTPQMLRAQDQSLAQQSHEGSHEVAQANRSWLGVAHTLFPRERQRFYWQSISPDSDR